MITKNNQVIITSNGESYHLLADNKAEAERLALDNYKSCPDALVYDHARVFVSQMAERDLVAVLNGDVLRLAQSKPETFDPLDAEIIG